MLTWNWLELFLSRLLPQALWHGSAWATPRCLGGCSRPVNDMAVLSVEDPHLVGWSRTMNAMAGLIPCIAEKAGLESELLGKRCLESAIVAQPDGRECPAVTRHLAYRMTSPPLFWAR